MHFIFVIFVFGVSAKEEEEHRVVGAPSSDIILPCSFPHSDKENLHNLVVSWQCNDTVVVHSYHDSQDQGDSQSSAYRGRTNLFHDQLLKGNSSLHLKSVRESDQGWYKCEVFSVTGNTEVFVFLLVAAPYDEPQLSIYIGCVGVNINVTTSCGFPQPVLLWRDETGSDITNHSQTHVESDRWGRLEVQNELNLPLNDTKTLKVEMTLEVLNQKFSRSLTVLQPSGGCVTQAASRSRLAALFSLLMLLGTFITILIQGR